MTTQENGTLARRLNEASNQHDLARMEEFYAPDWVHHLSAPGLSTGIEGARRYNTELFRAFPDCRFTIEDLLAVDDKVITRWSWSGTHRGELLGAAPSGKRITTSGISISRVAGGKFVESWLEWDQLGYLQQLGVVSTPEPAPA